MRWRDHRIGSIHPSIHSPSQCVGDTHPSIHPSTHPQPPTTTTTATDQSLLFLRRPQLYKIQWIEPLTMEALFKNFFCSMNQASWLSRILMPCGSTPLLLHTYIAHKHYHDLARKHWNEGYCACLHYAIRRCFQISKHCLRQVRFQDFSSPSVFFNMDYALPHHSKWGCYRLVQRGETNAFKLTMALLTIE